MAYDDLIRSIIKACKILNIDLNDCKPSNVQEAVRLHRDLWMQVHNKKRKGVTKWI